MLVPRAVALNGLGEASNQRADHASVAVVRQDGLGLARLVNMLLSLHKVTEAQVDISKIGMERGIEGTDTFITYYVSSLDGV